MAEEFYELLKRKNKKDRKEVIEHFAPLVRKIAGRIAINLPPSVEFNDLVSYGVFGLIDAVEKFDPDMNVKFEYYARTRISGSIYDALRKLDWAPRSIRIRSREIEKAIFELEQELGRDVNDEDIAKRLGVSQNELEKMFNEHRKALLLSLEGFFTANTDDDDKASFLKDRKNPSPEEKAEKRAIKDMLVKAINSLVYNERLVVTLYYYNEFTLKEIAATLDLTESRVSQIHSRAIAKLRARLRKFKKSMIA